MHVGDEVDLDVYYSAGGHPGDIAVDSGVLWTEVYVGQQAQRSDCC